MEYWETYDDQDPREFDSLGYTDRAGNEIRVKIDPNTFEETINEIYRVRGDDAQIKVYKDAVTV